MVRHRLELLLSRNLIGQDHLKKRLIADIHEKVRRPNEPLILHFAGDNGVGKTTAAQLISAALSFRCNKANTGYYCGIGEESLSLSGTNYHGMSVEAFRKLVVPQIVGFGQTFPFGVVILNDMTELDAQHVAVLMPLLGRSHYFSEDTQQSVDLRRLLVIVTTDFGKQGRTRGRDIDELHSMIEEEVRSTFGSLAGSYLRTYAFLPTSVPAARSIAKLALYDWACSERLADIVVEDEALHHIVDGCIGQVAVENGRAVAKHMESLLGTYHLEGVTTKGKRLSVQLEHGSVVLVNESGIPIPDDTNTEL
jgi:DNA polymerase III delta prime subunit